MKSSEIQELILKETGIKTSVSNIKTGSMKGYIRIRPMFQNGAYPNIPFNFIQKLKIKLSQFDYGNFPLFCSTSEIHVYEIIDDRIEMKKEKKPLPLEQMKVRYWGSKNSQLRYDKAIARNHKRVMRGDGGAMFW